VWKQQKRQRKNEKKEGGWGANPDQTVWGFSGVKERKGGENAVGEDEIREHEEGEKKRKKSVLRWEDTGSARSIEEFQSRRNVLN